MVQKINLDKTIGREVIEIQIGGETFRIVKVVNAVRRLQAERLNRFRERIESLKGIEEITGQELDERKASLFAEAEEFGRWDSETMSEIMHLLLTVNGYEYDLDWWERHAEAADFETIINASLAKDAPKKSDIKGSEKKSTQ